MVYITPLVINSLGGRHTGTDRKTDRHTHVHIPMNKQNNFKKPAGVYQPQGNTYIFKHHE